jgi:hypothetical protein
MDPNGTRREFLSPALQRAVRRRQWSALLNELAIGARREAIRLAKGAAEGVEAFEAALLADFADIELAVLQKLRRLAQSALTHVAPETDSQAITENGAQMADAIAELVREVANGDGLVEMFADVAIDILQDDIADVVAGMDVATVTRDFG